PVPRRVTSRPGTPRSSSSTRVTRASVSLGTTVETAAVPGEEPSGGGLPEPVQATAPAPAPAPTRTSHAPRVISIPWVLLEQGVAIQLVQSNRHEVHLVVPGPRLDGVAHVPVVRPGRPVGRAGPVEEDVDAARDLAQHRGRDHPAAHVEEALLLQGHLDASLVAVLVPQDSLALPGGERRHAGALPDLVQRRNRVPQLIQLD